jgi:hypothetical protein
MSFVEEAIKILGSVETNRTNLSLLNECIDQLVPFVGAGLSVGFGYPTWEQFLRNAGDHLRLRSQVDSFLAQQKYEEAAGVLADSFSQAFDDFLRESFDSKRLRRPINTGAVFQLARMARGLVLTTNFDHVLEASFEDARRKFEDVFPGSRIHAASRAILFNKPYLLKLHGDYQDSSGRVLTLVEYVREYGNPDPRGVDLARPLPAVLSQVLGARPLLFLGCSLKRDRTTIVVAEIAKRLSGIMHFALLPDSENTPGRFKELDSWNIRPLFFPTARFEKIEQFLRLTADAVETRVGHSPRGKSGKSVRVKVFIAVTVAIIAVLLATWGGAHKSDTASNDNPSVATTSVGLPPGEPSDYFPHAVGNEWQYDIRIGSVEPLEYQEVLWKTDKGTMALGAIARYPGLLRTHAKNYTLTLKVHQSAPVQGPLKYDEGVELAIVRDDLDIFKDHHQIFWVVTSSDRFMAQQIVTYPPDNPTAPGPGGTWGSWNQEGYSMQIMFFAERPKVQVGIGKDPIDTLLFEGIESCQGTPCLHFIRTVKGGEMDPRVPDTPESRYLGSGFTEDTWFAKGKGLIGLEQKVNGKTSMTWILKQFSPVQ